MGPAEDAMGAQTRIEVGIGVEEVRSRVADEAEALSQFGGSRVGARDDGENLGGRLRREGAEEASHRFPGKAHVPQRSAQTPDRFDRGRARQVLPYRLEAG